MAWNGTCLHPGFTDCHDNRRGIYFFQRTRSADDGPGGVCAREVVRPLNVSEYSGRGVTDPVRKEPARQPGSSHGSPTRSRRRSSAPVRRESGPGACRPADRFRPTWCSPGRAISADDPAKQLGFRAGIAPICVVNRVAFLRSGKLHFFDRYAPCSWRFLLASLLRSTAKLPGLVARPRVKNDPGSRFANNGRGPILNSADNSRIGRRRVGIGKQLLSAG